MCLIIYNPEAKQVPAHILSNAFTQNRDGFGALQLNDNCEPFYSVAPKMGAITEALADIPFIAHWRFATVGVVNESNCHPARIKGATYLFSNGTVAELGNDQESDTRAVAKILRDIPRRHWGKVLSMSDVRFAIVSGKGSANCQRKVELFGNWHQKDGVFYSNSGHFALPAVKNIYRWDNWTASKKIVDSPATNSDPAKILIAVYGTLKKGFGNHSRYLSNAEFVGSGVTSDKLRMIVGNGLPHLYKGAHWQGHRVSVEVYRVTPSELRAIDDLEGVAYKRELTGVHIYGCGKSYSSKAWVYFANHKAPPGGEFKGHFKYSFF